MSLSQHHTRIEAHFSTHPKRRNVEQWQASVNLCSTLLPSSRQCQRSAAHIPTAAVKRKSHDQNPASHHSESERRAHISLGRNLNHCQFSSAIIFHYDSHKCGRPARDNQPAAPLESSVGRHRMYCTHNKGRHRWPCSIVWIRERH